MRLPDNSDSACLIKADWLEDHGQATAAQELRKDVAEGPVILCGDGGGTIGDGGVGGFGNNHIGVVDGYGFVFDAIVNRVGDVDGGLGDVGGGPTDYYHAGETLK